MNFEKVNNKKIELSISRIETNKNNCSDPKISTSYLDIESEDMMEPKKKSKFEVNRINDFNILSDSNTNPKYSEERKITLESAMTILRVNTDMNIISENDEEDDGEGIKIKRKNNNISESAGVSSSNHQSIGSKFVNNTYREPKNKCLTSSTDKTSKKKKKMSFNEQEMLNMKNVKEKIEHDMKENNETPNYLKEKKVTTTKCKKFIKLKLYEKKDQQTPGSNNDSELIELHNDEIIYNQAAFRESNVVLFASIEILEKSLDNKNKLIKIEENQPKTFWSRINPFRCSND